MHNHQEFSVPRCIGPLKKIWLTFQLCPNSATWQSVGKSMESLLGVSHLSFARVSPLHQLVLCVKFCLKHAVILHIKNRIIRTSMLTTLPAYWNFYADITLKCIHLFDSNFLCLYSFVYCSMVLKQFQQESSNPCRHQGHEGSKTLHQRNP